MNNEFEEYYIRYLCKKVLIKDKRELKIGEIFSTSHTSQVGKFFGIHGGFITMDRLDGESGGGPRIRAGQSAYNISPDAKLYRYVRKGRGKKLNPLEVRKIWQE